MRRLIWILIFGTISCIDPYIFDADEPIRMLSVEGFITTGEGPHEIRLSRVARYGPSFIGFNLPETRAAVLIKDDQGRVIELIESESGVYKLPGGFRGQIGNSYNLEIKLQNGKRYISRPEKLVSVPQVDSLSYRSVKTPTSNRFREEVGVQVTAYFQDPVEEENYYYWRPLESTFILVSEPDAEGTQGGTVASCCSRCFHKDVPKPANVITVGDSEFNGTYQNRLIAYVVDNGMRFKETYRLDILHLSLSQGAHMFLNLVNQQLSLTGSVFDPPPANIRGNMICLDDPDEQVLGYFFASDVQLLRVYIEQVNLEFYKIPQAFSPYDCREYLRLMDPLGRNPVRPPLLPTNPPDDWDP
ncbi:DUF4249 domain-containing protein [Aquiflexum sp.]|uniref:DUF4249 domain-containing protein n=1 Tax=Aquiflexum sp. TaxID=1872584 RepID=UPI0035940E48